MGSSDGDPPCSNVCNLGKESWETKGEFQHVSNFLAGILVNFFGKPAKHRHLTPQKRERKLEKSRKKLLKLQHTFKFYVNLMGFLRFFQGEAYSFFSLPSNIYTSYVFLLSQYWLELPEQSRITVVIAGNLVTFLTLMGMSILLLLSMTCSSMTCLTACLKGLPFILLRENKSQFYF